MRLILTLLCVIAFSATTSMPAQAGSGSKCQCAGKECAGKKGKKCAHKKCAHEKCSCKNCDHKKDGGKEGDAHEHGDEAAKPTES